jgi:hypothetical protein
MILAPRALTWAHGDFAPAASRHTSLMPILWAGQAIILPSWPPPTTPRVLFPISIFSMFSPSALATGFGAGSENSSHKQSASELPRLVSVPPVCPVNATHADYALPLTRSKQTVSASSPALDCPPNSSRVSSAGRFTTRPSKTGSGAQWLSFDHFWTAIPSGCSERPNVPCSSKQLAMPTQPCPLRICPAKIGSKARFAISTRFPTTISSWSLQTGKAPSTGAIPIDVCDGSYCSAVCM